MYDMLGGSEVGLGEGFGKINNESPLELSELA